MRRITKIKIKPTNESINKSKTKEKEMKSQARKLWVAVLALAAGLLGAQDALAAGTRAGTDVDNMATIEYTVNTVLQDVIESSEAGNDVPGAGNGEATEFIVDTIINFTVTEADGTYVDVSPNSTDQMLTYDVFNGGNDWQDFSLSRADGSDPFGGTDNFNATPASIFVESGANGGSQPLEDIATYIDELAEDATTQVYVFMDIPATQTGGDISAQTLTAQVAAGNGGTTGGQGSDITSDDEGNADIVNGVGSNQIVFDVLNGVSVTGTVGDDNAYRVLSADLEVMKTSDVISDPVNGTSADAKAIPGAIVEYTIRVTNDAGATEDADNLVITDSLDTEITNGEIAFETGTFGAGVGIQYNINGGAAVDVTNTDGDADAGWFDGSGLGEGNVVEVSGFTLTPGDYVEVIFRVEIQ